MFFRHNLAVFACRSRERLIDGDKIRRESELMLNTTTKKSFVLAALMACTGLTSAQAQMLSRGNNDVSIPEMVTKTPMSREGDNLGDHTATQTLDLNGNFVTGIIMNTTPDSSDAVNVGFLDGRIDDIDIPEPDNLGNHIAEQILNMRGYKILNVANAYGGANGDAVNIWTLQRYLSEIPGPDNLGNHIATRDLFLNGHTIRLGPITSTDPNTGLPLAPSGLVINQTMVSGLDLPINGSDAANKAYVDGIVGSIDMSNVVYTVGDQSINGVKTFVQQIQANGGLNSGNQKIVSLADPTAPQDAVNLRTMETAITNIEQNLVISTPYTVRPVATGSNSMAAGASALAGGTGSIAFGSGSQATGVTSVAIGNGATTAFPNDVVIGSTARNLGDSGRNIIIGSGPRVNRGQYNIVLGFNAQATSPSTGGGSIISIGESTSAAGQHAVAMGPGANASVNRALAIGSIATASSNEAVAIGRLSVSSANNAIALGHEAQATATNAVAVGRLSVANIADTVSVGNDTIKRRILNVGDPSLDTDAVNLRTLRTEISAYSRYSAGDGILFGAPVAGITPINVDTTVVRTVGTQVIGGNKTFTSSVVVDSDANSGFGMRTAAGAIKSTIFSNADSLRFVRYAPDGTTIGAQLAILADGRIMPTNGRFDGAGQTITSVADPVNPTDAVNLRTLQNAVSTGGDNLGNHIATTILNMSNNRIINVSAPINGGDAVNKTYVDNLVAGAAYTAGSGIAINAANVISVDTTVVRTTGNQNIDGNKTFSSSINIAADTNQGIRFRNAANLMQGFIFGNANSVRIYAYQADGSTVGGQLAILADGRIQPATGRFDAANRVISTVADPVAAQDAVNLRTLQSAIGSSAYTAGDGLALTGNVFSVNTTVVRTAGDQTVAGNKTFSSPIRVVNTFNIDGSNPGDQQNGLYVASLEGVVGTTQNPVFTAAIMAQTSVNRSIGVTVDNAGYLYGFRSHSAAGTYTWQSRVRQADTATTLTTPYTGGSGITINSANVVAVDGTVVRTTGNQSIAGLKTFTTAIEIINSAVQPGLRVTRTGVPYNSSMSFTTDAGTLYAGQGEAGTFALSNNQDMRYATNGVFEVAMATGDVRWKGTATGILNAANARVQMVADPTAPQDAVNLRTLQAAITAGGDNLGNHIATTTLNLSNNRIINVAAPINGGDAVNKTYVDNLISGAAYTAGTGITIASNVVAVDSTVVRTAGDQTIGGSKTFTSPIIGELSVVDTRTITGNTGNAYVPAPDDLTDRSFSTLFSQGFSGSGWRSAMIMKGWTDAHSSWAISGPAQANDERWFLRSGVGTTWSADREIIHSGNIGSFDTNTTYTAGSGLSLTGTVFAVDTTVVRTTGNQNIAGIKTFTTSVDVSNASAAASLRVIRTGSTINSGMAFVTDDGTVNVGQGAPGTFSIANNNDMRYATNGVFEVAASTGNVRWKGVATGEVNAANTRVQMVADPTGPQDAVNLRTLQSAVGSTSYTAADGLTLTGNAFSVNTTVVRTTGNQTIGGTKSFTSPIVVTNTFDVNGSAANAQQNGFYIADLGTTVGTTLNPVQTLGIMAQTNAARSIGVTVDSSGYLYGFRSHSAAGTYTWQSRTRFADRLTTARTINGVSFDGSSNITIPDNNTTYSAGSGLSLSGTTFAVDNTVVRTTGNQDIAGLKTFTNGDIVLASNTNNNMYMRTGAGLNRFLLWAHGTNGNSYLRNYDTDGTTIASELVLTGNGLIFPTTGNLDGNNRVITRVANPVNQTDAVNLRSLNSAYTGGSGINVSSQVVSVDSSVVRTSGDQTISGVKTFNGTVNMNGWDTLRLNAGAATLQVGPNQVRTATDTDLGFYAGNRAGNARISMYLTSLGTVTYDSRSYNSPIMYIGIPYQAGITGNVVAGTGQDAGDDGAGTIAAISYRDFRIFRRTSVSGGFAVFGSRANDIARFDVPMVGYNGLTVSPGTGGEIRFHAPIYAHSYQTFSDERLKDNIETIEADDGLNIIRDLRPAFFTYKEDGRKASGVIAQEIQKTMPWAVLEAKDGMLTVDYTQIIAPLTAAVQNVDARTSELEAQLAAEIQRNDALEARIEKLEALMSQEP